MISFSNRVLSAQIGETWLFFTGQAGFIVKNKRGALFALDLYLSDCVERVENSIGFKRMQPKILEPAEIEFDIIVATHPHVDHFDIDSVSALTSNEKTVLLASVNCEEVVKQLGVHRGSIKYVSPGDSFRNTDFEIDFINCDHGVSAPDALGVILTVDEKRICFVGDSCLRLDRTDEYLCKGELHYLIAPINGAYGNMNENDCAELSAALNPRYTIPCHYGMFASHGGDLQRFIDIMDTRFPEHEYIIMSPGEGIKI